jgi:hypothetical protein
MEGHPSSLRVAQSADHSGWGTTPSLDLPIETIKGRVAGQV